MIENLYFMPNLQISWENTRNFYLFSINEGRGGLDCCDRLYIECDAKDAEIINKASKFKLKSAIVISIGKNSKNIASIEVTGCPDIVLYNVPFPQSKFLSAEMGLTITTQEKLAQVSTINSQLELEVFSDALVINLGNRPKNSPYFLIHEKNMLGLLIDDSLVIHAIVILNLSKKEMAKFKGNYIRDFSKTMYQEPKIDFKELVPMKNKNCFIKKIIELKNVNLWHLLYYCYHRCIIDDQFLIDFAIALLENNINDDPTIVEMAGVLDFETKKAQALLEQKITAINKEKILYTDSTFYNRLLFYLIFAAQMCREKVIE